MRRTVILLLFTLLVFPVIGQDRIIVRSCRPGLEKIDLSKHTQRRVSAQRRSDGDTVINPYIGERRQLVVLAKFADQGFLGDSLRTLEQWDKILNTKNLSDTALYGSLHDYFYAQSYGQFDIGFDLLYVGVDSMEKYHSTSVDDENSKYLVQDVVSIISNNVNDWGLYDWNKDGKVDQLLIIYAGRGQNDGGSSMTIWPHQWWLSERVNFAPIPVTTGPDTYLIDAYCAVPELSGRDDFGSFGTLCHEFSHCLGLPDFYGNKDYVGEWDLMDHGNFNGRGFHPCGYSAYERAYLGWLTPVELDSDTVITGMKALSDAPVSYLIRNEGWADEYYLVENRQKKEWDEMLPGSGIVVFHVDYDENIFQRGWVNSSKEQRYVIFAANDEPYAADPFMKGWAYPHNDNNSLTNTSTPAAELNNLNKDGSLFMSKPITEMTVTEGIASFSFRNDMATGVPYIHQERFRKDDSWYRIDSRLYIHQGKVVLVR
ncbi:MAG: M6 family metalloprotease domain-containing protein [Bacteroidaceae bacterium]|nr:M6 family metalloprotease domain-containing protein [Bacteroidaceae bacterium]